MAENINQNQLVRLALAYCSLSYQAKIRLFERFPDAEEILSAPPSLLYELMGEKALKEWEAIRSRGFDRLYSQLETLQIRICFREEEAFPKSLLPIPDSPELLFYKGVLRAEERCIAIVGSRRETRYGREQAFQIAKGLAEQGVCIISGLARGIDTAAHQGALAGGGRTLAVLGSGLENIYPSENLGLARNILDQGGALISELPHHAEPLPFHFPIRNRLVSGLAQGLLLIEAREKSGTLITVGHALAQGREVFALPGQVDSPGSIIPHRFLREGARLATCAQDILEDMNWACEPVNQAEQGSLILNSLSDIQQRLYEALEREDKPFDELMALLSLSAPDLNVEITLLELEGLLETLPGHMVHRRR